MGTFYRQVRLMNRTEEVCTLKGYPELVLIDAAGDRLGKQAQHPALDGTVQVPLVTLKPAQSAVARVGFPNAQNFLPATPCSANASTMRIFPPGQSKWLSVPIEDPYCPGFNVDALRPEEGAR
jgi:hypothetical protein